MAHVVEHVVLIRFLDWVLDQFDHHEGSSNDYANDPNENKDGTKNHEKYFQLSKNLNFRAKNLLFGRSVNVAFTRNKNVNWGMKITPQVPFTITQKYCIPKIVFNPQQKIIQKSSLNRVINVGYKVQRLLYSKISTPWNEAEIKKNLLDMATIRPKL